MKNILVIGMGKFGILLAENLIKLNNQVMIADKNEDIINELAPNFTNAVIGDATNAAVLKSMDIASFDICFVTIGSDFQSSLEITCQLKELGAKYVISKADRDIQAKFLLRNGADEIVYPDRDTAFKLAVQCNGKIFNYTPIAGKYSMYEIEPPKKWCGKTIMQINIRKKYNVNVLAVKHGNDITMPTPDYVVKNDEHLLVLGKESDVAKITK